MNHSQCYKALGVNEDASIDEIKNAYWKLALEYHPDKNNTTKDGIKFKMISEAYHTLRMKNISHTMTEHSANKIMNKDHQCKKKGFSNWRSFIHYKINYRDVRRIFSHYLKYEPTLFEYCDKVERRISRVIRLLREFSNTITQ